MLLFFFFTSTIIYSQGVTFDREKNQLNINDYINPREYSPPSDDILLFQPSDSIPYDISHEVVTDILAPEPTLWDIESIEGSGFENLQNGLREQLETLLQNMREAMKAGQLERSIDIGNKVYNLADRFRLNDMKAKSIMHLIRVQRLQGNRVSEYELSREVMELGLDMQDTTMMIRAFNSMGQVFKKTDNLDEANRYSRMALTIAQSSGNQKGTAASMTQIGTNYLINENYDSARYYLKNAADLRKKLDQPVQFAQVMIRLGRVYLDLEKYDSAQYCFERSLEISYFFDAPKWIGRSYHHLGRIANTQEKYDVALTHFDSATTYLTRVGDILVLDNTYEEKSLVYKKTGNSDSAFHYYQLYRTILDTLEQRQNTEAIYGLELTHQINKQERQIDNLNEKEEILTAKREAEALANIWLFIALGVFIAISFAFYFLFKQRSRLFGQEKKLRELDQIRAEQERLHEQQLRVVEKEKFSLELELKNKELTTLTMQMLKKSEDMSGLQSNLKNLEETVMSTASQDLKLVNSIRSISREIKSSLGQDQEWEQFKLYFEQVHENFFTKLKQLHPKLTAYDLKLCAYFHMNLGIKQVANIMNVSHDAVKKQRTRMRKKMQLENEINLLNYLEDVT